MEKQSRREQVLARSRQADARRLEALKESDGCAIHTPAEEVETVEEELEQDDSDEVTDLDDESGE